MSICLCPFWTFNMCVWVCAWHVHFLDPARLHHLRNEVCPAWLWQASKQTEVKSSHEEIGLGWRCFQQHWASLGILFETTMVDAKHLTRSMAYIVIYIYIHLTPDIGPCKLEIQLWKSSCTTLWRFLLGRPPARKNNLTQHRRQFLAFPAQTASGPQKQPQRDKQFLAFPARSAAGPQKQPNATR